MLSMTQARALLVYLAGISSSRKKCMGMDCPVCIRQFVRGNNLNLRKKCDDVLMLEHLGCVSVQEVDLSNNKLEFVPSLAVRKLTVKNNMLKRMEGTRQMRILNAEYNLIDEIDMSLLESIEKLSLSHNPLRNLTHLEECKFLQVLQLSHCMLTSQPKGLEALTNLSD